jgi:threonylcarbamoyladenosine tRNA methylthiotransferase MtaB
MARRFSIITLGCKVNQYDGAAVSSALADAGLLSAPLAVRRGPASSAPDLVVINTCCVTATAMAKSRQAVRRAVRSAPDAAVLVVGCYCDYDPRRIQDLLASTGIPSDRAFVAGHHDDLAAAVREVAEATEAPRPTGSRRGQAGAGSQTCLHTACRYGTQARRPGESLRNRRLAAIKRSAPGTSGLGPIRRFEGHQRAFVKVQDGCDAFCSYCVVPYARCRVWSRSIEDVVGQCRSLAAAGHKEIVLCGVFLGAFGRTTAIRRKWNSRPSGLPELLRRVAGIEGLWRVRLSSLEPLDLDADLLSAMREIPNFAPHLHLPLQSGSDGILRRMNRQYATDDYRRAVDSLRADLDRPAITTDIIVGFPGETDEDFAATLRLARYAGFAKIHAFPFSPIEGAAAWTRRREAPPPSVVRGRMAALAELERELAAAYRRQFVGQKMEGIVERAPSSDRPGEAMTDRYVTVFFRERAVQPGDVVRLDITREHKDGLEGAVHEVAASISLPGSQK